MGYVLVIATLLISCGKNPPATPQHIQQLVEKEQKLIQALKSLWKAEKANFLEETAILEGLVPADTRKIELCSMLQHLMVQIQTHNDITSPEDIQSYFQKDFEEKNIASGRTKTMELLQVRKERFQLLLGIDKQKKQAA